MKRIKSLELVCIDVTDPTLCDMHVTWEDNTFTIFYDGDHANFKRVMHQFALQARQRRT